MRRPRDFDSELKALAEKAKQLKERRVRELGALVTASRCRAAVERESAFRLLARSVRSVTPFALKEGRTALAPALACRLVGIRGSIEQRACEGFSIQRVGSG